MTIPNYQQAMVPVLRALESQGLKHRRELSGLVAEHFELSEAERAALLPSGKTNVLKYENIFRCFTHSNTFTRKCSPRSRTEAGPHTPERDFP